MGEFLVSRVNREAAANMIDDETQLIRLAQQGDAEACTALYDRHYDAVYRYCYCRVSDVGLAQDITSEMDDGSTALIFGIGGIRQTDGGWYLFGELRRSTTFSDMLPGEDSPLGTWNLLFGFGK